MPKAKIEPAIAEKLIPDVPIRFLFESNKIEDEFDADSLVQSVYAWNMLMAEHELTLGKILKAHKILMLHQPIPPNARGYLRHVPVWIQSRSGRTAMPAPEMLRPLMIDWLEKYQKLPQRLTYKTIKQAHVEFEKIHPFIDGNGRVGRLILAWMQKQAALEITVIEADKRQEYYEWFRD